MNLMTLAGQYAAWIAIGVSLYAVIFAWRLAR